MLSTGKSKARSNEATVWKLARVSCDTCFTGHLGHRIRWWHCFTHLSQGSLSSLQKGHILKLDFSFTACLSCPVFFQSPKMCPLFLRTKVKNDKNRVQKSDLTCTWFFFSVKNQDIGLKLCQSFWVSIALFYIGIAVLGCPKTFWFYVHLFLKIKLLNLEDEIKKKMKNLL